MSRWSRTSPDGAAAVLIVVVIGMLALGAPTTCLASPTLGMKPDSLPITLLPGETAERTLLISNAGTSDLDWTAYTSIADAFYPRTNGAVFTFRDLPTGAPDQSAVEANGSAVDLPAFGTRICSSDRPLDDEPRILVLASHDAGNDAHVLALQRIGLGCTVVTQWSALASALVADGPWDLVIVNSYNTAAPTAVLDELALHLDAGRSLIYADWSVGNHPGHGLFSRLGIAFQSSFTQPLDFAAVDILHRCFRRPNNVTALHWNLNQNITDGQIVTVLAGAQQLAAFQGHPESGAIVLGASGHSVFNGFQAANFQADDDGDNLRDMIELAENEIGLVGFGPRWLEIAPLSGTLPPGGTQVVTVTFGTVGHCGVERSALVVVECDDPQVPAVAATATLTVPATPHVAAAPEDLAFGIRQIGTIAIEPLNLSNDGCSLLTVTAITSDHAAFGVATPVPFTLAPGASRTVSVSYAPAGLGLDSGVLTILSDSATEPATVIPLTGIGGAAPTISVAPDSLALSLDPGTAETTVVTIHNSGLFDLSWSASVDAARALALRTRGAGFTTSDQPARSAPSSTGAANGARPDKPLSGRRFYTGDRPGSFEPHILLLNSYESANNAFGLALQNLGFSHTLVEDWFELEAALIGDGPWDLVIVDNYFASTMTSGLDALVEHLDRGGCLIFGDWAVYSYDSHDLLSRLGVEYQSTFTTPLNVLAVDPLHRCFREPNTIGAMFWNVDLTTRDGQIAAVRDGAQRLAEFEGHPGSGAIILNGTGRAIFNGFQTTNYLGSSDGDGLRDAVELAENEILLVGFGPTWLTAEPATGVVPGGQDADLTVVVDAAYLCGGDFAARIDLTSNDPQTPLLALPVSAHVDATPDIFVTPTSLAFGNCYLDSVATRHLDLVNDGCAPLTISGATSSHAQITLPSAFPVTIVPNTSYTLQIDYHPVTVGPVAGTITLTCDDPDEPVVTVPVSGMGLMTPAISLTPDTLTAELGSGGSTDRTLTIANEGGSEITWSARILYDAATHTYTLPPPNAGATAAQGDPLTGVRVMWAAQHGQVQPSSWASIIGDLGQRGAAVVVNTAPVTDGILDGFDIVWTVNSASGWSADEFELLAAWVRRGGGLLLTADNDASCLTYNNLLSAVGAGISYSTVNGYSGVTTWIAPHETTSGVSHLYFSSPSASLQAPVYPGRVLINGASGSRVGAWSETGSGRVIALSDESFQDGALGYNDNRLFANQVFDWLSAGNWLQIAPLTGTVPPGSTQDLTATFDATGRCDGTLTARIALTSNDPVDPELSAGATLVVHGDADITVAPDIIAFPSVFHGAAATASLVLTNDGCAPLSLTAITSDNSAFAVDQADPTVLPPRGELELTVSFTPSAAGAYSGTMTIASDDPDEPAVTVALSGASTEPPVITLLPASMSVSLAPFIGDASLPLTIGNSGYGDLIWTASVIGASSLRAYDLPPLPAGTSPAAGPDQPAALPHAANDGVLTAALHDLTGVRIMWDRSHGQSSFTSWLAMIGDLQLRGAAVVSNTSSLTPELLSGYDILWTVPCSASFTAAETSALANWLHGGGSLLLEGDTAATTSIFNAVLTAAGAGITYSGLDAHAGTTTRITPHATTRGVDSLYLNSPGARLAAVDIPAQILVQDDQATSAGAWSHTGSGRVIALSDEMFASWCLNGDDNRLFGNQVFDWLAGAGWLQIEPEAGVVPSGEKLEAKVWFNTAGICGGDFSAHIDFASNDPLTPVAVLPASLAVAGEPEIAVSPAPLDFGSHYIGAHTDTTLTIANTGCSPLTIDAVSSDNTAYAAAPAGPFTVEPYTSQAVIVTFTPSTAGLSAGILTIASDDTDEPMVAVAVSGIGLPAPAISVSPDSLLSRLYVGETETRSLTIANEGLSDLFWTLATSAVDDPAGKARAAPRILLLPTPDSATDAFITALDRLGLAYASTSDWTEFTTWLTNGAPWDLVIVNNAWQGVDLGAYAAIRQHLDLGRSLIFSDMGCDHDDPALLSRMGITYLSSTTTAMNFSAVDHGHRCFRLPNAVHDFFWDVDSIGTDAFIVDASQDARILASFQGVAGLPAVVLGPSGRTIYNAFPTRQYVGDDDGDGRRDIAELAENEITTLLEAAPWLSASPTAGVIPPGEARTVTVGIDASFLSETTDYCASVFEALIALDSNDPSWPTRDIPVELQVIGEPDIEVAQTSLAFAPRHVGAETTWPLNVANRGCEPLTIWTVTSDHPAFTVAPAGPLALGPDETRVVSVTFAPIDVGDVSGALTIASDDRRRPSIVIPLAGTGLAPPRIVVSPDTLAVDVPAGDVLTRILTISDQGPGDLNWTATTCLLVPADQKADAPRILLQSSFEAQNDAFALALQRMGLGHTMTTNWEDFVAAATAAGPWDLLIANNYSQPTSGSALNTMLAHLDAGGSLIFADWGLYYYVSHALLPRLGIDYRSTYTTPLDVMALDGSHACFRWPNELHELRWDADQHVRDGQLVAALPGAHRLATFPEHPDAAAIILDATGRAIYNAFQTANYTADDDGDGLRDAVELAQNEIALVGLRADWLAVTPEAGLVPPGETREVTVSFDATNAAPGTHRATIVVQSDDPATPLVIVPAIMTVTGSVLATTAASPKPGTWALTIGITGATSSIVIGQHTDATDGRDPDKDLPAPARSAGEPNLALPRPEWADAGDHLYAADIRAADAVNPVYAVRLITAAACKIHLRWNPDELPVGLDLELRGAGHTLLPSLRGEDGVTLTLDGSPLEVEFVVVSVSGAPSVVGPALFNLPNPFNPSTMIGFQLERGGEAAVLIHDACGMLVRRLDGGRLPAGPASLEWDGCDRRGHVAASGVYLYRLLLDGRQQGGARKMVLVR